MLRPTLIELSHRLASGDTTSRALVEASLGRIADPSGEGARAFLTVYAERARAEADAVDAARKRGEALPRFTGIPLAIKDLFDVEGEPTRAGSKALADAPPATADADVVARVRGAGFVILGKANMTEFAFGALGLNPHYGTPLSPWDRACGRIPGGSCRIPAAFCGIVGMKPTQARVSLKGVLPLAPSLDSVGPFADSVACCAALDDVLSGGLGDVEQPPPLPRLTIGLVEGYVDEGLDHAVASAFAAARKRLAKAGAKLMPVTLPELAELPHVYRNGSMVEFEAFATHRRWLETRGELYDPWVRARLEAGREKKPADYIELTLARARIRAALDAKTRVFDALALPTVPIAPPAIGDLGDIPASRALNALILRNTSLANFLDRPAISIPCHTPGEAPVGFMLMGETGLDRRLLAVAQSVEAAARGEL